MLGYIDFRREILHGDVADFTCLLGTMVQEAYETEPANPQSLRREHQRPCRQRRRADIAAAKKLYAPDASFDPQELALFTQAVMQGAFILAKAKHGPETAEASVLHLRRYIEFLFGKSTTSER